MSSFKSNEHTYISLPEIDCRKITDTTTLSVNPKSETYLSADDLSNLAIGRQALHRITVARLDDSDDNFLP